MPTPRTPVHCSLLVLVTTTAGACGVLGRPQSTRVDHMYAHFSRVGEVQRALILGDLEAAREPARWLAEHAEHPAAPRGGDEAMNRLRAAAREVAHASTVRQATRGAASMAAACGACHSAVGSGLRMGEQTAVPAGDELGEHMLRHLWAADRMWEGLISPSDDLWREGATALAEEALFLAEPEEQGAEVNRLGREVHQLATEARRTSDRDTRADLYGKLLATCADCHALAGVTWAVLDR